MNYTEEALRHVYEEYSTINERRIELASKYLLNKYRREKAQEYAQHGFCRRIALMARCIENVFESLPPEVDLAPDYRAVRDATIFVQSFMFNTFGCLDNLAHIWASENELKEKNGNPLRDYLIGFRKNNIIVLDSLPKEFRDYLNGLAAWFQYLEDFRHALAHRVPLYIPPHFITSDRLEEYREIDARILRAASGGDYCEAERLEEEKFKLVSFVPITTHSINENSKQVYFHVQMLTDFKTVEEIGVRLLDELDGQATD